MKSVATCTLLLSALLFSTLAAAQDVSVPTELNEATIAQLQADMASHKLTSVELTRYYLKRIDKLDQHGPGVNSIIEVNPDALAMARRADELRARGFKSMLLGIPVLLK